MRAAAIVAHPDDETLGAGATLARLSAEGHDTRVLCLADGVGSRGADARREAKALEERRDAGRRAMRILGVREIEFLDLPDNRLDTVPLLEVAQAVERFLDRFPADLVLTHHRSDLNVDHRRVLDAVGAATRPTGRYPVRAVLSFEVPSATDWSVDRPVFSPSVFYDVSSTIEKKLAALDAYAVEMRPFPHPRSPEGVRALATLWGARLHVHAAEAFEPVRELR